MNTKELWARTGTMCACVAAFGVHGTYNFPVGVYFILFPSIRCMTRGQVSGLIFLSGNTGRIICPVAPASTMAWLTSIFILDVLNRISCFGYYMISMDESSISAPIWAVMSSLQLLWIIFLSY